MDNLGFVFLSEMLGTMVLVLIGLGINATATLKNTHANGDSGNWLFVALGWGIAIMAGASIAGYTGGAINPAVALGLLIVGTWDPTQFAVGIAGELVGALIGAYIILALFWTRIKLHLKNEKTSFAGILVTGQSIKKEERGKLDIVNNLLVETIGTFLLVFFVTSPWNAFANPLTIGLLVFAIGASIGSISGFAINPARDLMPRLALWTSIKFTSLKEVEYLSADWGYSWVAIVGPLVGGAIAGGISLALS